METKVKKGKRKKEDKFAATGNLKYPKVQVNQICKGSDTFHM